MTFKEQINVMCVWEKREYLKNKNATHKNKIFGRNFKQNKEGQDKKY